jgi:hypothetical protein
VIEAYPLYWPEGRPRTARHSRENAKFNASFARARDDVVKEIGMLRGRYTRVDDIIVSTNIALRRDGLPLAGQRQPEDTGVAVYFDHKKRQVCFACDRWIKIEDNMRAIALTIGAIRGIARWGTGDMMEAAFRGFTALPSPGQTGPRPWHEVLAVAPNTPIEAVQRAYQSLRSIHHPDKGGNASMFDAVQKAWEQAQQAQRQ